ncbi:YlbG family protein [Alteribacter populi]|uniref:YlbG family protein n=1 Tax=Alteribacter populi TaxID=2011011 RepID=UPI000BBA6014|nr:YlbG family protein [Alteribacter populi]
MIGNRVGLAVWVQSLKHVKQLRRFGNIHYVSRKMKYIVIYCDGEKVDQTKEKLESFHFVKRVSLSMRPWLNTEFQNSKPDKAKEYDYKMGL